MDVSMLGVLTSLVAAEPFDLLEACGLAQRTGRMVPRLTPFGFYESADGHVAIKAFLYLRELIRRGVTPASPPVLLFDRLQSKGPDVPSYVAARTRDLFETLVALGGSATSHDYVREAILRTNVARGAMRRLLALRRGEPRVSGAEVLPLLGAFWRLAPDEYAALANEAAEALGRRAPVAGPRVCLAGAPVDGPALHAAIEALGAVVVAEAGPWGGDTSGEDASASRRGGARNPPAAAGHRRRSCHTIRNRNGSLQ